MAGYLDWHGAELNISSEDGKVWVQISDSWREGDLITVSKGMNNWFMQGGELKRGLQTRVRLYHSSLVPDAPKGETTCLPGTPLILSPDKVTWNPAHPRGIAPGEILVI